MLRSRKEGIERVDTERTKETFTKIEFSTGKDSDYLGDDWDTFYKLPEMLTLDLRTGKIKGWKLGKFNLDLKMVDRGYYRIYTSDYYYEVSREYVPEALAVPGPGWGDYINLEINSDGSIVGFNRSKALKDLREYVNDLKKRD